MYADEYLPDDAVFDNDADVSIDETSSMDTQDRNIKKRYELYKRSDSDYYSFKVKKQNEDGDIVQHKVEVYSSPMHGYIRNASSGLRESYNVGSKYEDLFFSVSDVGIHWYGKSDSRKGRKLAHYTLTSDQINDLISKLETLGIGKEVHHLVADGPEVLTHSLTHSPRTHSPLTHSLTSYSLTRLLLTHSPLTHSLASYSLTHLLTHEGRYNNGQ